MKIYVVNLKSRLDRKEYMLNQFEKFGITDYEFIEAIDGSKIDTSEFGYNEYKSSKFCRPLTKNEIACVLSHNYLYEKIIQSGERCVILEDDVTLSEEFAEAIKFSIPEDIDLVMLGYYSSNKENEHSKPKTFKFELCSRYVDSLGFTNRSYFKNEKLTIGNTEYYKFDKQSHQVDFIFGTHAYSPSINTCKLMLLFNKKPLVVADYPWNLFSNHHTAIDIWGAFTPLCIQNEELLSDISSDRKEVDVMDKLSPRIRSRMMSSDFGT